MDEAAERADGDDGLRPGTAAALEDTDADGAYDLGAQVGFLLRRANQRHLGIFNARMRDDLTAQQLAVLVRTGDAGAISQNELGRRTAMDQSTVNGVVRRLIGRGLLRKGTSDSDRRLTMLSLTGAGRAALDRILPLARAITEETLAPLDDSDRRTLIRLLRRIS